MSNIDTFYRLLNESTISLLGYTFKEESLKDELISKIPHYKVSEIDSSFNLKSTIRDFKINSVLSDFDIDIKYLVIDLQELKYSIKNKNNMLEQLSILYKSIENIAFQFYDSEYKLIITSPVNKTPVSNGDIDIVYMGGNKPVYLSDVAFNLEGDKIRVIKNRHGDFSDIINIGNLKENSYKYKKSIL